MSLVTIGDQQLAVVDRPIEGKLFLQGSPGTGKSTAAVSRLLHIADSDVPADSILVTAPQRTLARPYYEALRSPELAAGGEVTVVSDGALARRMLDLFWPLISEAAGFAHPHRGSVFLTLETAQDFMARVLRPLLAEG